MEDALDSTAAKPRGKWTGRLAYSAAVIFIISLAVGQTGMSAFGAMSGLLLAILLGLIAFIIVLIGIIKSKGLSGLNNASWIAIGFGALAIYKIAGMASAGGPPIHDISTDTVNPPEFIAVIELRGEGENTTSYIDDGTAELQLAAYPDLQTIVIKEDKDTAFARAIAAAEAMGWEIVADDPPTGRIEATATTPFVGFKDDVVIRVRAGSNGTEIDVRSKSRIGKGDMGVNAARIRAYSEVLIGGSR
jgi:uncharacterized protein (DUF1499 family)